MKKTRFFNSEGSTTKRTTVLIAGATILSGCGGGGSTGASPAPSPNPSVQHVAPGVYGITINEQGGAFNGTLLTGSSETIVYAGKVEMGFGTWSYANGRAQALIARLAHPVDDLGNSFPAAKSNSLNRSFDLEASGSAGTWAGGGVNISSRAVTAPNLATISRNWRFANLYRFGGMFLDYTLQIDIDSAGILSGFDTNGCSFSGELRSRSDGVLMYDARIIATGCGATENYIENAEYTGFAYITSGPGAGQTSLEIDAVNRSQQGGLGVAFSLVAQ